MKREHRQPSILSCASMCSFVLLNVLVYAPQCAPMCSSTCSYVLLNVLLLLNELVCKSPLLCCPRIPICVQRRHWTNTSKDHMHACSGARKRVSLSHLSQTRLCAFASKAQILLGICTHLVNSICVFNAQNNFELLGHPVYLTNSPRLVLWWIFRLGSFPVCCRVVLMSSTPSSSVALQLQTNFLNTYTVQGI